MSLDITIETITPELARQYLGPNRENRKIRQRRVEMYADQMRRGQWQGTGDPFRFDPAGRLLDGQHRLLAVIASKVPLEDAVVIRDVPTEAFKVLDTGLGRGTGDSLGVTVDNSNRKAAACRLLWVMDAGGDPRLSVDLGLVTRTDVFDYYQQHRLAIDAAVPASERVYRTFRSSNPTAWTALIVLGWRINPDWTNEFVERIISGVDLGAGDPRLALRNFLARDNERRSAGQHLALYIKAWNDWLANERRQLVSIRPDEIFPLLRSERITKPLEEAS